MRPTRPTDLIRRPARTRKSAVSPLAEWTLQAMMAPTGTETPMTEPSLLARKLRAHRARGGKSGRMTQEELAELLDVSVDAIGKYERSVSFVRGDLEHRLIERLGWSLADVADCRTDWEANHLHPRQSRYRLLDEPTVA